MPFIKSWPDDNMPRMLTTLPLANDVLYSDTRLVDAVLFARLVSLLRPKCRIGFFYS